MTTKSPALVMRTGLSLDLARISRDAALIVGVIVGVGQAMGIVSRPIDAALYWRATDFRNLYATDWTLEYNYAYPPPLAQVLAPFHVLPFEVFVVGWTTLLFACLWYCARSWTLPLIGLGLVAIMTGLPLIGIPLGAVLLGNVVMLLSAGIVAGLRHPAAWTIVGLTKVGPTIGVLWHPLRGEWRTFRRATLIGIGAFALSFALAPAAWFEWVDFVIRNYGHSPIPELPVPFPIRALAGLVIVVIAARTDRAWLVPIGAGLALPADYGGSFVAIWVGALALSFSQPSRTSVRRDRPG